MTRVHAEGGSPGGRVALALAVALLTSMGACQSRTDSYGEIPVKASEDENLGAPVKVELFSWRMAELVDDSFPILAIPHRILPLADESYVVLDRSDRDMKVYGPSGVRTGTLGRAGLGPGEFVSLSSIFTDGEQVGGFDFSRSTVTVFDSEGEIVRVLSLDPESKGQPMRVRMVNDSVLLLVYHPVDNRSEYLLETISYPQGETLARFLPASPHYGDNARLRARSSVLADGHDDCVVATLSGSDSVWVFDTFGQKLGAGVVNEADRWPSLKELLTDPSRLSERKGLPIGERLITAVVALPECSAAVQVGRYRTGGDAKLHGGQVHVIRLNGSTVTHRGQGRILNGGLMGRDRDGSPLGVTIPESVDGGYDLFRLTSRVQRVNDLPGER